MIALLRAVVPIAVLLMCIRLVMAMCGPGPAPAAEADPPGWRYTETIDGDTLAFAVPALPAPLARVLVRMRGVDTPSAAARSANGSAAPAKPRPPTRPPPSKRPGQSRWST